LVAGEARLGFQILDARLDPAEPVIDPVKAFVNAVEAFVNAVEAFVHCAEALIDFRKVLGNPRKTALRRNCKKVDALFECPETVRMPLKDAFDTVELGLADHSSCFAFLEQVSGSREWLRANESLDDR
jgi:hypothetical protein